MIKSEQIPDEVVRVINEACDSGRPWNTRDTIAAALNAWPGGEVVDWYHADKTLILPLTQEDS